VRALLLVLLITAASVGWCQGSLRNPRNRNDVLVLIQPALAEPQIDPTNYWVPEWVLWPSTIGSGSNGQLLTIGAGEDWFGGFGPMDFITRGILKGQGYFFARSKSFAGLRTHLLMNARGDAIGNAILLSVNWDSNAGDLSPSRATAIWPKNCLMIAEALSWDDVAQFESGTSGRVLVVEYPPRQDQLWTRFWLRGHQWPSWPRPDGGSSLFRFDENTRHLLPRPPGSTVPGLVPAKELIRLVTRPELFQWDRLSIRQWPGANRFLALGHGVGRWVALAWLLLSAVVVVWGTGVVSSERSSRALPQLLVLLLLSPAILDLAGWVGRHLGIDTWPVWVFLAAIGLMATNYGLNRLLLRNLPKLHPLAATYSIGLVVMIAFNPVWSFLSPTFGGRVWPISPVAAAAVFGYLAGLVSSVQNCQVGAKWFGRGACVCVLLVGLLTRHWLSVDLGLATLIPISSFMIGERLIRKPMFLAATFWPTSTAQIVKGGLIWAPAGLLRNGHDMVGLNGYEYFEFLTSGCLLAFLIVGGGIVLFGHRFFYHQIKSLLQLDLRRYALPLATGVAFAAGLLHPIFLYVGMTLATGALTSLLFDAVQTM